MLVLHGVFCTGFCLRHASAQNDSAPGTPTAPFPTIENLSIVWPLDGDDNNNGQATVRYRKTGQTDWIDSAPLRRIPAGSNAGFSWENKHAGSIVNLHAGTSYEIELSLTDPDGGNATQTLSAQTRPWPVSSDQGTVVTPATIAAALANISAGDVLILADGNYSAINIGANGTLSDPIVVRAQNIGGAIVAGDVRFDGQGFIHIVGLTVEGQIKFNGSNDIVIRDCLIITDRDGIVSFGAGVSNALIMDNTVIGPTQWNEATLGNNGNNLGEGIVLTGPGNVIAFNRVEGFRDGISLLEDNAVNQQSIDIYGNDIYRCGDDGIEADFSMGNVRVHHNRLTDCFIALSSQPSLGGPTFFYRNVVYNAVYQAFKPQRSSNGDLLYHNTIVKPGDAFNVITGDAFSNTVSRNNIFIGGPAGTFNGFSNGADRVVYLPSSDASCDFNYDGFGSIGTGAFVGQIGPTSFNGLAELQTLTTETNAVQLDLSVFADSVSVPANPVAEHDPPSFELAAQSTAIDAGFALAGFNDGFAGSAPDMGAYELGQPTPVYGPGGNLGVDVEAPRVESIEINDGSDQRSMVRELVVSFDDVVIVDSDSFLVENVDSGVSFEPDVATEEVGGRTIATLTFSGGNAIGGSLADGNYVLTVLDSVNDVAGNQLDGDDGDGVAGGNATSEFIRIFGDMTGDGMVSIFDLLQFRIAYRSEIGDENYNADVDYSGDGRVDIFDLLQFRVRYRTSI
jgi:hypothetical protein